MAHYGRHPAAGAQASIIHGTRPGLRVTCGSALAAHPPTPQSIFVGTEMSLQEKGQVVQLAVTLLGRAARKESILPVAITTHCRSLVPLGAGTVVGLKGRPLFTRPMAVWHHLKRLQKYTASQAPLRWTRG